MVINSIKPIALSFLLVFLLGCNKKKFFDGPNAFTDGFESYSNLDDLLLEDDSLWSFTQTTLDENSITVDSMFARTGSRSLKFVGGGSQGDLLSKCSIVKQKMAFWEGEVVYYSVWYYLEGGAEADWLFLIDLEEQIQIGAGPGMRIALVEDSTLLVEHKYPNPNIEQDPAEVIAFPRDQWVHIEFETLLSQKEKGYVKVWQDGELIIEQNDWQTLPKDVLTAMQGTKGMYSSFEIGLTANSGSESHTLWADDVEIGLR